jgi:hypothetical protein
MVITGSSLDFSAYIAERTRDFTGREWVLENIDTWLADRAGPRYFLLTGAPGSDKSAIVKVHTEFSGDLAKEVACFAREALAPKFAPLYEVGENYAYRPVDPFSLPLPDYLRTANTINDLSAIFLQPLRALQELNPGLDPDEALPSGTRLRIPDRTFGPHLAAYFSAAALAGTSLTVDQRVTLIKSMVPIAQPNPTALDAVLSRLMLATLPDEAKMLQGLEMEMR